MEHLKNVEWTKYRVNDIYASGVLVGGERTSRSQLFAK